MSFGMLDLGHLLHWVIGAVFPLLNFCGLLVVLRLLRHARFVAPPQERRVCFLTDSKQCLLKAHRNLLCEGCQYSVGKVVVALRSDARP
jgi:hypothetical protein